MPATGRTTRAKDSATHNAKRCTARQRRRHLYGRAPAGGALGGFVRANFAFAKSAAALRRLIALDYGDAAQVASVVDSSGVFSRVVAAY